MLLMRLREARLMDAYFLVLWMSLKRRWRLCGIWYRIYIKWGNLAAIPSQVEKERECVHLLENILTMKRLSCLTMSSEDKCISLVMQTFLSRGGRVGLHFTRSFFDDPMTLLPPLSPPNSAKPYSLNLAKIPSQVGGKKCMHLLESVLTMNTHDPSDNVLGSVCLILVFFC